MKTTETHSTPLYRRVADDIMQQVATGNWRPGDRLLSEKSLCERYKVSQITVRRALRELAHDGRVFSHHGLGWFVSEEPATASPSQEVTLILPELDWVTAPLVRHLSDELNLAGVALRLAFAGGSAEAEAQALDRAVAHGDSAVLLVVTGPERQAVPRYTRLLEGLKLPALLLRHQVPGVTTAALVLDERSCLEQTTRHVLACGHRRLAYAGPDPSLIEGQRCYWGFATTLWGKGLELTLDWVFAGDLCVTPTAERFRRVFQEAERPTALVCASDLQAAQAQSLLQELELQCPEDVAIVGLGDQDFAPLLATPLTTVHFDWPGLAHSAAVMTLDLLAGRVVQNLHVTGQLVTRSSCPAGSRD